MLSIFLSLLSALSPGDINTVMPLLDHDVVVEKVDGTTANGKLISVTTGGVVVRLVGSQRLLEIPLGQVESVKNVAIDPAGAPPPPPQVAPPAPPPPQVAPAPERAPPTPSASERRQRNNQQRDLKDAREDLAVADREVEEARGVATAWTTAAGISLGMGCGMIGVSFVACGIPMLVGGSVALVWAGVSGIVAATSWNDVSLKEQTAARRREKFEEMRDEMEY